MCPSCDVSHCNPCIVKQSGMLEVVCMVSILNTIPSTSAPLLSMWFCLESQYAMKISGPDSVATSFLKITTSSL